MSRRSSDSALVVDLDGVLRIWDPQIVASAERRAGLPPGALDRAAIADPATLRTVVTGGISDAQWRAGIAARLVAVHGEVAAGAVAAWSGPLRRGRPAGPRRPPRAAPLPSRGAAEQRDRPAAPRPAGRLRLTGADGGPGWTRARSRPLASHAG